MRLRSSRFGGGHAVGEFAFARSPVCGWSASATPTRRVPGRTGLEPLSGSLRLAQRLSWAGSPRFRSAWNFGPTKDPNRTARERVEKLLQNGDRDEAVIGRPGNDSAPHEAPFLHRHRAKARQEPGWTPTWPSRKASNRPRAGIATGSEAPRPGS